MSTTSPSVTTATWSSNYSFLMATIGIAVGLGNIWRFPYVVGTNGGGAFVMVYLLTLLCFAAPIMIAELILGRQGGKDPWASMLHLIKTHRASAGWAMIGVLSLLIPFVALAYYSVVAGWTFDYAVHSMMGSFEQISGDGSKAHFQQLSSSSVQNIVLTLGFIAFCAFIISKGLKNGLEKSVKFLMPLLFFILIALVVYAAITGDFQQGFAYLFTPDITKITPEVVLAAMGQAFFSLGVGAGSVMAYGGYLSKDISIPRAVATVAFADTLVALLAGLAIFPFVFAFNLEPASGPGLIFEILPLAFGQLTGGRWVAFLFFVLLAGAALTTALSMLECLVRYVTEKWSISRARATAGVVLAVSAFAVGAALSFGALADFKPLSVLSKFADKTLFDLMDYAVANVMIPLNALLIVLFCGWILPGAIVKQEYAQRQSALFMPWQLLIKTLIPLGIIAVLFAGI